jgi:hypothetical protein
MQMNKRENFERLIHETQQMLAEQEMRLQTCVTVNQNISHRVASLLGSPLGEDAAIESVAPHKVAIDNGRRLSQEEFASLNEDKFDVILDMTNHTLRFRKDPARHTALQSSELRSIGPQRLQMTFPMSPRAQSRGLLQGPARQ